MKLSHTRERFDAVEHVAAADEAETLSRRRPQSLERPGMSDELVDWIGFLRRHIVMMILVWTMAMAAAVYIVFNVLPKEYQSDAKFLVRTARQELVVGPNSGQASSYRDAVTEEVLNTEVELLRSRDILAGVVADLNLGQPYVESGRDPQVASELALRDLSRSLVVGAIRKTNIVQVSYLSQDPKRSADVVQRVTDGYLAAHLAVHSSPGTYELFKAQAAQADEELRKAEAALTALARSANLINLDTQKKDALENVNRINTELDRLAAEIKEQNTRAKVASTHLASVPERVQTQLRNVPNQFSVERLHTLLVELNNKRTELLTKFNADDRVIVEIDTQIADTNGALERARGLSANEESTDVNPAWRELESERLKARLALSGLESKAEQLRQELAEQRAVALSITEAGPEYEALVRQVEAARQNRELYTRKEEEARIADALDRQRISNVVLAQAPVISHVPAKPNKRFGVVIGAIAASVLALGLAFARELMGHGSRHSDVQALQVTVVGVTRATAE